jgi:hypothetical protein
MEIISLNSIKCLIIVVEMQCVQSEIGTESLQVMYAKFRCQRFKSSSSCLDYRVGHPNIDCDIHCCVLVMVLHNISGFESPHKSWKSQNKDAMVTNIMLLIAIMLIPCEGPFTLKMFVIKGQKFVKIGEDSIHKICLQLSQICRFVDIGLY